MQDGAVTDIEPEVPDEERWAYEQDVTDRVMALVEGIERTMGAEDLAPMMRRTLAGQEVGLVYELLDDLPAARQGDVRTRLAALGLAPDDR